MAFPSSPTVGQQVTESGRAYQWTGSVWNLVSVVAGHAATHGSGQSDAVTLDASQIGSGTLDDARLSGNVITATNLAAQQYASGLSIESPIRPFATTTLTTASGTVYWTFLASPFSFSASQITYASGGSPLTSPTLVRFGLYTVASNGDVTLVARTASDTTIFSAATTSYTRSFATAGGYPATYQVVAGTRYAIAMIFLASNAPSMSALAMGNTGVSSASPRTHANLASQSDLPTSVASGGFSAQSGLVMWGRLS